MLDIPLDRLSKSMIIGSMCKIFCVLTSLTFNSKEIEAKDVNHKKSGNWPLPPPTCTIRELENHKRGNNINFYTPVCQNNYVHKFISKKTNLFSYPTKPFLKPRKKASPTFSRSNLLMKATGLNSITRDIELEVVGELVKMKLLMFDEVLDLVSQYQDQW